MVRPNSHLESLCYSIFITLSIHFSLWLAVVCMFLPNKKIQPRQAKTEEPITKIVVEDGIFKWGFVNETSNEITKKVVITHGATTSDERMHLQEFKTTFEATAKHEATTKAVTNSLEFKAKFEGKEESKRTLVNTSRVEITDTMEVKVKPNSGYAVHQVVYYLTIYYSSGRVAHSSIKSARFTIKDQFDVEDEVPDHVDSMEHIIRYNKWAQIKGFFCGLPNFEKGNSVVGGSCLPMQGAQAVAEWRDVSPTALTEHWKGLSTLRDCFIAVHRYANAEGFIGGFPVFLIGATVCKLLLWKKNSPLAVVDAPCSTLQSIMGDYTSIPGRFISVHRWSGGGHPNFEEGPGVFGVVKFNGALEHRDAPVNEL